MLALFIGLLLLVGINAIFSGASQAIQAGLTLNEATRNSQAAGPILYNDMHNCATDSPAFIITSSLVPQWLNKADADANSATPGTPPAVLGCAPGDHLHRCDQVMFFARGIFKRKTADSPNLVSTTTSDEAYIHYGHLRTTSDGITFIGPDDYAGLAEPYAADWSLGRNVILAADAANVVSHAYDVGTASPPIPEAFFLPIPVPAGFTASPSIVQAPWTGSYSGAANVTPLGWNSLAYQGTATAPGTLKSIPWAMQGSRYDLAGTTIDQFRSTVTNSAAVQASEPLATVPYFCWWAPLIYAQPYPKASAGAGAPYPILLNAVSATLNLPFTQSPYYTSSISAPPANGTLVPFPRNRFQGSSVLSATPLASADQAGLSPFFLQHVSQFIVEYAGDFVTQDNSTAATSGQVIDTVPDGQIDWLYATKGDWNPLNSYSYGDYVIYSGQYYFAIAAVAGNPSNSNPPGDTTHWLVVNLAASNPPPPPKTIRWYGMPRDVYGTGQVYSSTNTTLNATTSCDELNNVVPLADIWRLSLYNNGRPLPYEVETGQTLIDPNQTLANVQNYATSAFVGGYPAGLNPLSARYTAVWRNDVPAMIRILIKVDDPNNAIKEGPWYEYVFKLK
jgi:hypothetical protein